MKRRDFIKALGSVVGGGAVAWPLAAGAQRTALPVIGFLAAGNSNSEARLQDAFVKGLSKAGYDRRSGADRIRCQSEPTRRQHTGATLLSVEVGPKLVDLLHVAVPSARTMVLLINPTNPNAETQSKSMQQAALKLGLTLNVLNASAERDFDAVFAKLSEFQAGALVIGHDVFFNAQTKNLAALALRNKLPAIYTLSEFAASGGLMSYGASRNDAWHQGGIYVGRILKGEKPAELPVIQPTAFEMVINVKTAKVLGVSIPLTLIARADEIIE
jgi:putative ABC transport system substrate-binding protein